MFTTVVICFQICTFEPLETAPCTRRCWMIRLWFAFKFVPLNHWKQHGGTGWHAEDCCDLLSNLYLWTIGNSLITAIYFSSAVVICFQICTFEPLETAAFWNIHQRPRLWFAFKFVPLNHWKQLRVYFFRCIFSCDLLSNLYLWTIGNSHILRVNIHAHVVICFQICTFEPLETASQMQVVKTLGCDLLSNLYLWTIGNSFVSRFLTALTVVICFQICTFEPLETARAGTKPRYGLLWFAFKFVPLNHWKQLQHDKYTSTHRCDLLSNLYLWTIGNSWESAGLVNAWVVICFQICTFEPLETATGLWRGCGYRLWFAFKFVPLNHWKQRVVPGVNVTKSCDLLSNLYLWTIGNSPSVHRCIIQLVVICFQICTFEPLETARVGIKPRCGLLWFAFKFVPLNHWKQPTLGASRFISRCDLLSNLYLWTIGNSSTDVGAYCYKLWFAFKFVPLNHWKQRELESNPVEACCDLLSNLYLWTIGNSINGCGGLLLQVVICFQICTFEPLETAGNPLAWWMHGLWFAFKFVPLNHWKQQLHHLVFLLFVVICFQICTFEPLETATNGSQGEGV